MFKIYPLSFHARIESASGRLVGAATFETFCYVLFLFCPLAATIRSILLYSCGPALPTPEPADVSTFSIFVMCVWMVFFLLYDTPDSIVNRI